MATLNSSSINGSLSITGDISNKKYVRAQPSDENTAGDSYQNDFLLGNSFIGSMCHATDGWQNIINVRHRNGDGDGTSYGLQIVSGLTTRTDRLYFRHQSSGTWGDWYSIANLGDIPSPSALSSVGRYPGSGAAGTTSGVYVTPSVLYYWNGAVTGTTSSLQYCDRGRFGTIVTASSGDYAAASHTHSYLPLSGGTMSNAIKYAGGSYSWFNNQHYASDGSKFSQYNENAAYITQTTYTGWQAIWQGPNADDAQWSFGNYANNFYINRFAKGRSENSPNQQWYFKSDGSFYSPGTIYVGSDAVALAKNIPSIPSSLPANGGNASTVTGIERIAWYNNPEGSSTGNYFGAGLKFIDSRTNLGYGIIRIDWGDDYTRGIYYNSHSDRGNTHNWRRILDSDCVTYTSGTGTLTIQI